MKSAALLLLFLPATAALCVPTPPVIRRANWPDDFERVCAVRKPTEFVSEAGTSGFMGQTVELDPEEAQKRRVQARLGSALRDNATVIIAVGADGDAVVGTVDCVPLAAGKGRRAFADDLPARVLVRNVWVAPEQRKLGIGRRLMAAAEEHARADGFSLATLEVARSNAPAIALYNRMEWDEVDEPGVPNWLKGPMEMRKELG